MLRYHFNIVVVISRVYSYNIANWICFDILQNIVLRFYWHKCKKNNCENFKLNYIPESYEHGSQKEKKISEWFSFYINIELPRLQFIEVN